MREVFDFDKDWLYQKEEKPWPVPQNKAYAYAVAKTERVRSGPAAYQHFDNPDEGLFGGEILPEKWQKVNLPHDYIISQRPDPECSAANGFFHYHNAWYRKHFTVDPADRGRRISLLFDGVTGNSTVWLNGCLLAHNFCGFTPFEVDISDYVFFDRENVLAVYVDLSLLEGWWYAGGGIYRDVTLIKSDKVCADLYGVWIHPVLRDGEWRLPVRTTVRNDTYQARSVRVRHTFYAPDGRKAQECLSGVCTVPARETADCDTDCPIAAPQLWDIDRPNLYTAVTEIVDADTDETLDEVSNTFGIRSIVLDPDRGCIINGHPVKIKGLCGHQDFGLTGLAVPANIYEHRVKLMRGMGANAFRNSHYPHNPAQMDALDRAGMLCLGEIRHFDATPEAMRQLDITVKRDRNRPCVFAWSTGNEELIYHTLEQGVSIQKAMYARVRKWDDRPITSATGFAEKVVIFDEMDLLGINYRLAEIDRLHAKYPGKPVLSTENCAVGSSYGTYMGDREPEGRLDARDRDRNVETMYYGREGTWKFIAARDFICGGFQWDAVEHRGEATWPRLCSASGALDLFLQKKDAYYQNQSMWLDTPMIHLVPPHWNFRGLEGETVPVWIYTNCNEVELRLNGSAIWRGPAEKFTHIACDVPYEPGTLEAVGFRDGREAARHTAVTTGPACALKMQLETAPVSANEKDIALVTCYAVDANGMPVADAEGTVRFECDPGVEIVGTGSSSSDHEPVTAHQRAMFAGRITVAVRVTDKAGQFRLFARGEKLGSCVLHIPVAPADKQKALAGRVKTGEAGGHLAGVPAN